jgi:hypothetical protein
VPSKTVSDPPRCGADDEAGVEDEVDDPQPARTAATAAARMIGLDRMNLRL